MNKEEKYNPLLHRTGTNSSSSRKGYSFDFARVDSPVNEQVLDFDDLAKTFKDLKLIPYSGTDSISAHTLLKLLNKFRWISGTLGSLHLAIKTFALGSTLEFVHKVDRDFDMGEDVSEPINISIKRQYKDDVLSKISYNKSGARDLLECCYDDFFDNGNYGLEVVLTETNGVRSAKINYHHSETICPIAWDEIGGVPRVALSKKWDYNYLSKNPPKIVPLGPNFVKDADNEGVMRTFIMCINGNFVHWGRPVWMPSWLYAFREYQDVDYLIKAADNKFTGQIVLEFEGEEDEETGDTTGNDNQSGGQSGKSFTDKIEDNFTAKAKDPMTVLATERPSGARPMVMHQVKVNLQEGFYDKENSKNRQKLIEALSWSERLLGNVTGNSFASDSFMSELKVKDSGILRFFRERVIRGYSEALGYIRTFLGKTQFDSIELQYKSLFGDEDELDTETIKQLLDAYGVAVRAGAATPNVEDEEFFREKMGMAPMSASVLKAWKDADFVKSPITLKDQDEKNTEAELEKQKLKRDPKQESDA